MGGIPKRRGRGCGKGRGELSADRAILHGGGGGDESAARSKSFTPDARR